MSFNASTSQKFDFDYLWTTSHNQTVRYATCVEVVGTAINWYDRHDVYDRILLWRVPLLALLATTTLPAFGYHTQFFTVFRVIADPIDSIWSLLYKLDLAKRTTRWAKGNDGTTSSFTFKSENAHVEKHAAESQITSLEVDEERKRTALINVALRGDKSVLRRYFHEVPALIITAYDEWGYGDQAWKAMNYGLYVK